MESSGTTTLQEQEIVAALERLATSEAFVYTAMVRLMVRRLARA
jgi:hypothetical protein